jgi:hypothetical protein
VDWSDHEQHGNGGSALLPPPWRRVQEQLMQVTISLSRDEALVLFEFLARFDQDNDFTLRHTAEYLAFQRVAAQLEKTLVEPFSPDYDALLEAARNRVAEGYEGPAPGVEHE